MGASDEELFADGAGRGGGAVRAIAGEVRTVVVAAPRYDEPTSSPRTRSKSRAM
jgi:hypothetical protein